jgi:hypothetical protein
VKSRDVQLGLGALCLGWVPVIAGIAIALSSCGKSDNEKMKDRFTESRETEEEYLAQKRIEEFQNKELLDNPRSSLQPPSYQPSTDTIPKTNLRNLDELLERQERKQIKDQLDRIERKQREQEMQELARSGREAVMKGLGDQ